MAGLSQEKRFLVVVADDFGRSADVDHAIGDAHDHGILTSASIIAGGASFDAALEIARVRKRLSVGLHLTLCDGRAVSHPALIPDLVDRYGNLEKNPVKAWFKYSKKSLRQQIETEIEAQFARLEAAGIIPSHVDGHHHLQMHPVLFRIVCRLAAKRGVGWIRIPKEPLKIVMATRSPWRGAMPFVEWAAFGPMGICNAREAHRYGIRVPDNVYGLARTGAVDEEYLLDVLGMAAGTVSEIFTHPDTATEAGRIELMALKSGAARRIAGERGLTFAGYADLSGANSLSLFAGEGI